MPSRSSRHDVDRRRSRDVARRGASVGRGAARVTRGRWPGWSAWSRTATRALPRGRRGAGPVHRPGPGHRADRLARRGQVDHHQRAGAGATARRASGSACSRSTRPARSPAGRSSATGSGCRTTRPTRASTSGRCPAAGISAGCRRPRRRRSGCSRAPAATSCWSRPSASGRPRSRWPSLADTTLVLLAPGMGDAIQAVKAGILEIADVFVVNKADRDGADATVPRHPGHDRARRARPGRVAAAGGAGGRRPGRGHRRHRGRDRQAPRLAGRARPAPARRERRAAAEVEEIALGTLRARMGGLRHGEALPAWPPRSPPAASTPTPPPAASSRASAPSDLGLGGSAARQRAVIPPKPRSLVDRATLPAVGWSCHFVLVDLDNAADVAERLGLRLGPVIDFGDAMSAEGPDRSDPGGMVGYSWPTVTGCSTTRTTWARYHAARGVAAVRGRGARHVHRGRVVAERTARSGRLPGTWTSRNRSVSDQVGTSRRMEAEPRAETNWNRGRTIRCRFNVPVLCVTQVMTRLGVRRTAVGIAWHAPAVTLLGLEIRDHARRAQPRRGGAATGHAGWGPILTPFVGVKAQIVGN